MYIFAETTRPYAGTETEQQVLLLVAIWKLLAPMRGLKRFVRSFLPRVFWKLLAPMRGLKLQLLGFLAS